MSQKGFSVLVVLLTIIVILILIIISGAFFYLGKMSSNQSITKEANQVSENNYQMSTPFPSTYPVFGDSKKRFISQDEKLIGNLNYPEEIFRVNENNLMSMACSVGFMEDNGVFSYFDEEKKQPAVIEDLFLLDTARKARELAGDQLGAGKVCRLSDGRSIVVYEVHGGGGGSLNRAYIGELSQAGNLVPITVIPNDGIAYFECDFPIQFNLGNMLWVKCGGGDGAGGSASIYRVDFQNKTSSLVTKCESTSSLDAAGNNPTEKCQ